VSRRVFLSVVCGGAAAALLAACGGSAAPAASGPNSAAASTKPAASPAGSAKPAASGAARKLTLVSTSLAGTQSPLWIAEELKLWDKLGLSVDRKRVENALATKMLATKEVDAIVQSPTAVITGNLNGGLDLVYVAALFNYSQFSFQAPASINSGADVKGKSIGTDKPGTTVDFQTKAMLKKLGVQPSEVTLTPLETSQGIFAALTGHKIDIGTISIPQTFQAEAQGFHAIANTYDVPYQNIGIVVSKARLADLTPALIPLLQGLQQAIQAFNTQPDLAKSLIGKNTEETDNGILQKSYDFYTKDTHFQQDLQPTIPGMQNIIDFLAGTILPAAKDTKPAQFIDTSVLEKLPKS
jgi:ABC-type nitrate/sulfonate/bicarbonate transport system substrate-binding protein